MKKSLLTAALLLGAMATGTAQAADMECRVGTTQNSGWSSYCFGMNYSMNYNPVTAYFRIQNLAAPVAQVIWQGGQNCSATSTSCNFKITPYQEHVVSAIVLYTNGTYESVSATAQFETGF